MYKVHTVYICFCELLRTGIPTEFLREPLYTGIEFLLYLCTMRTECAPTRQRLMYDERFAVDTRKNANRVCTHVVFYLELYSVTRCGSAGAFCLRVLSVPLWVS